MSSHDARKGTRVYLGAALTLKGTTQSGLYRRSSDEAQWERLDAFPTQEVYDLKVDPSDLQTLYAGTDTGLYVSKDGGDSWQYHPIVPGGIEVWDVYFHPERPQTLLVGTAPVGIYRSEDGGDTWTAAIVPKARIETPFASRVLRIASDPIDPNHMACALEISGLLTSTDGGATWKDSSQSLVDMADRPHLQSHMLSDDKSEGLLDAHGVAFNADGSELFYACRMGLMRSGDQGQTFTDIRIADQAPRGLSYSRDVQQDPSRPNRLYLCIGDAASGTDGALVRSENGGKTWGPVDIGTPPDMTMIKLSFDPRDPDRLACVARKGPVYVSVDNAESWENWGVPEGCRDLRAVAFA